MATKGYTTRQAIENYLLINIDPSFNDQVDAWIEEIEKYIDHMTGRNFKADENASRRRFSGDNTSKLVTDDFVVEMEAAWVDGHAYAVNDLASMEGRNYKCIHAHTSAEATNEPGHGSAWETEWELAEDVKAEMVDSDPFEQDDMIFSPENAMQIGKPYTGIRLIGSVFYKGEQNVSVKARWGYSIEPPVDIRTVATVLVSGIINYSWQSEGEVESMTIGRYSVTYKDEKQWQDFERVEPILASYRKYNF